MALINCSECGHEISDKALRCPNCGCPIERVETIQEAIEVKEPKKSKTWILGIFAFLLCIIGVGCYFYFINSSHEDGNIGLENDFAQKIKGKYTIVVWNDNFGEFYNTEGGRLCSFELSDGRKEPMTLRLSQSLNILGKSTDRLYLSSNRLFADYSDYLNFNSSYNPNKELGVAVECSNEDDATFYVVKIGKGQIEEKHITLHQVKAKAGTDYVLLYYNDEYGTLYDRNGKRICGVSRGYSSAGDLHVKFTKTISFYNSTTNELLIKDNYVYLSSSDLIHDKYRKEGEPTTRKASSKTVDENDAVIYEFSKIDADTELQKEQQKDMQQKEEKLRESKAIVGTYFFNPCRNEYATTDIFGSSILVGYTKWSEYLVVMDDLRVTLLKPNRRNFVGTVTDINDGIFVISTYSSDNARIGAWTPIYQNGREIGRLGDKGYGFPKDVVIDTKTKRIYNGIENYKNKDISDVEYIMYEDFSSEIKDANNSEYKQEYLNEEYERKYGI